MRGTRPIRKTLAIDNPSRRGALLTVVMIALLICSLILGSILTLQIRHLRQLEREESAQQADLFAQAGLERALIRLKDDPAYRREDWKPSTGKSAGLVTIEVIPSASSPQEFKIQIAARYPAELEHSPQRIREVTIHRPL